MSLLELADRVEKLAGPCRETDVLIWAAITPADTYRRLEPGKSYSTWQVRDTPAGEWRDYYPSLNAELYTASLNAIRSLGGMVVFASDIGADGLAMVKIVADTSTSPVIEHTGIAPQLERAWLAAALRARAQE